MHKKVALSGYFGFDNFGDDAILSVLCDKLKLLNAEITVFSANPIKTAKEFLVNSVGSFDLKNVIKTIFKTDVLISGGGSLLQDATSFKSLVYYSGIIFLALLYARFSLNKFSRSAFNTTDTLEKLIASAPNIGVKVSAPPEI